MKITPLIVGLDGAKAEAALIARLKRISPAGILLLARNIESPGQVFSLTHEIIQRLGRPLIFAIDHEGGNVTRFSTGLTAFPSARALGRTQNPQTAYAVGREMALELSSMGINLNLAPVLDVSGRSYNPGIGIRSLSEDFKIVLELGINFIQGLQNHGVWACAKHFPGMGEAVLDPHIQVPQIKISKKIIFQKHLPPFLSAIKAKVSSIMTSHILYPKIDSSLATFSRGIVTDLLRKKLGFQGVVISDDLSMGAVLESCGSIAEAALQSVRAGHDLLIIADKKESVQRRAAEAIFKASQRDAKLAASLSESQSRISLISQQHSPFGAVEIDKANSLALDIARQAVRVLRKGKTLLPMEAEPSPLLVIFPKLSEIQSRFAFENGPQGPAVFLRSILDAWGPYRLIEAPINSAQHIKLKKRIEEAKRILFFCFEARRFSGQAVVAQMLNHAKGKKVAVVLMRGDADFSLFSNAAVIDPAGDRLCQIKAALEVILK